MDLIRILTVVLSLLIGIACGSFLNVLIYRLPRGLNPVKGFSFCPSCEHRLRLKDMVPLFSWLFLKGRCGYCGARISPRYPVVEAITGCGFALIMGFEPIGRGVVLCLLFAALLTISLIDIDTQIIPDSLNIAVAVIAIVSIFVTPLSGNIAADLLARLIGALCVSLPLLIIVLFVDGSFGGGDIKLMAAAGLLLGWKGNIVAFFIGAVLGGIYAAVLLIGKRKGSGEHFAFGPFLCAGIMISALVGDEIVSWYMSFL